MKKTAVREESLLYVEQGLPLLSPTPAGKLRRKKKHVCIRYLWYPRQKKIVCIIYLQYPRQAKQKLFVSDNYGTQGK